MVGIIDESLVVGLSGDHQCSLHDVALSNDPPLLQWAHHMMHHLYWVIRQHYPCWKLSQCLYIVRVILVITGFIIIMWVVWGVIRDDYIVIVYISKPISVTA